VVESATVAASRPEPHAPKGFAPLEEHEDNGPGPGLEAYKRSGRLTGAIIKTTVKRPDPLAAAYQQVKGSFDPSAGKEQEAFFEGAPAPAREEGSLPRECFVDGMLYMGTRLDRSTVGSAAECRQRCVDLGAAPPIPITVAHLSGLTAWVSLCRYSSRRRLRGVELLCVAGELRRAIPLLLARRHRLHHTVDGRPRLRPAGLCCAHRRAGVAGASGRLLSITLCTHTHAYTSREDRY
jgi:hypothetical protein